MRTIDIRHEVQAWSHSRIGCKRFAHECRAEVGAADADVDDVGEGAVAAAAARPAPDFRAEPPHCGAHVLHVSYDIPAVERDRLARTQRRVQCRAVLCGVDPLAAKKTLDPLRQCALARQHEQQAQRVVGGEMLGVIEKNVPAGHRKSFEAARLGCEQLAQAEAGGKPVMIVERLPGGKNPGGVGHRSRRAGAFDEWNGRIGILPCPAHRPPD